MKPQGSAEDKIQARTATHEPNIVDSSSELPETIQNLTNQKAMGEANNSKSRDKNIHPRKPNDGNPPTANQ
jgi:hypothetical protein